MFSGGTPSIATARLFIYSFMTSLLTPARACEMLQELFLNMGTCHVDSIRYPWIIDLRYALLTGNLYSDNLIMCVQTLTPLQR